MPFDGLPPQKRKNWSPEELRYLKELLDDHERQQAIEIFSENSLRLFGFHRTVNATGRKGIYKVTDRKGRKHRWSKAELEYLKGLLEENTPRKGIAIFRKTCKSLFGTTRSKDGVKWALQKLGISQYGDDENDTYIKLSCLAHTLGVSTRAVNGWKDKGLLPDKEASKPTQFFYKKSDVRKFIKENPKVWRVVDCPDRDAGIILNSILFEDY